MSAAFMYRQKVDISYCGNKIGFSRPGHILLIGQRTIAD